MTKSITIIITGSQAAVTALSNRITSALSSQTTWIDANHFGLIDEVNSINRTVTVSPDVQVKLIKDGGGNMIVAP